MMKSRAAILGASMLCFLLADGCATTAGKSAPAVSAPGIDLFKAGKYAEAESALKKDLEVKPKDVSLHYYLGQTLYEEGRMPEAREEYRKTLALAPSHTNAGFGLVLAGFEMGEVDSAVKELEAILSSNKFGKRASPEQLNVHFVQNQAIVFALLLEGDYAQAASRAGACLGDVGTVKTDRGGNFIPLITPWTIGFMTTAKKHVGLEGVYAAFFAQKGKAEFYQGLREEAREDFRKSLANNAACFVGNAGLGFLLLEENTIEASHVLKKALDLAPTDGVARLHYAIALKLAGDPQADEAIGKACDLAKIALDKNRRSDFELRQAVGFAHQACGRWDEALAKYRKVIDSAPQNGWCHRKMAEVYLAQGKKDLASEELKRAKELMPKDPLTDKLLNQSR